MASIKDLSGQKFGKLTVLRRGEDIYYGKDRQKRTTWICECECGKIKQIPGCQLKTGRVKSCGCIKENNQKQKELRIIEKYKEKPQCTIYDKRLHNIWIGIKERCYTESSDGYKQYGERGIDMCDEWRKRGGFWAFRDWALANGYREDLTIDRIDNNKGYYPDNCRWATYKEQANNTRSNIRIKVDGEEHTLTEWSGILGVSVGRLYALHKKQNGDSRLKAYIRFALNPSFSFGNYKNLPPNLEKFTEEEFLEIQNRRKARRKEYLDQYNMRRRKKSASTQDDKNFCRK